MEAPPDAGSALLTDLYQLTMMNAYCEQNMEQPAVFEFFVRRLPAHRNFLIAAGLEQVLDYLETLRFSAEDIAWLAATGRFGPRFLSRLEQFRFTGDVYALAEGTAFFASEPVLRVVAPLPEAQLVESRIINLLQYQTLIASKAARCRLAAGDLRLVDFGMRRAHGAEAALLASRASYLAGFDATATVLAGRRFGIPLAGTMAHSFVQAHDLEAEAFRNFAHSAKNNVSLLIDTYDTAHAARKVVTLAGVLAREGIGIDAVRIDSGDLAAEARVVRSIFDAAGLAQVRILVSGNLDEYAIADMRRQQAPIDAYCVGTRLSVSDDAPSLDCAYKLQEYAGVPRRKRSPWKETWPGRREVMRQYDDDGRIALDVICCSGECMEGRPLLQHVMTQGRRRAASPALDVVRQHCRNELATLPTSLRSLEHGPRAPVKVSARQHALTSQVDLATH